MAKELPERPSDEMVAAGAAELEHYLGVRHTAARRWAVNLYDAMVRSWHEKDDQQMMRVKAHGVRHHWPPDYIRACLAEAADTVHLLPMTATMRPAKLRGFWPSVVQSYWEAGTASAPTMARELPSGDAVARLDHVLEWLLWLTEDARYLVWCRAAGVTWPRISQRDGRSERALRYKYAEAIDAIGSRLTSTKPRMYPFLDFGRRGVRRVG